MDQNLAKYFAMMSTLSERNGLEITFILAILLVATFLNNSVAPSLAQTVLPNEDLEEVRDNLAESREELQKGSLTSALQHINQADQQLLALMNNTTSPE